MTVCPKCERNLFDNETVCSNFGAATGEVAEQAPAENQRSYGMFTGAAICYLVLCILPALVCLVRSLPLLAELDRPGVDTALVTLIGFGAASLISGFIVCGFSKLAVDAAHDMRIMAETASVQIERTSDQTRLLASIANDLSTREQSAVNR